MPFFFFLHTLQQFSKHINRVRRHIKREKGMKRFIMLTSAMVFLIVVLSNWTAQDTTISGGRKQRVNFYGILETQEGNTYNVENISIGMKYKQIHFFEAPKEPPKDLILTKDPRKGFISKIDLAEVLELQVPRPNLKLTLKKGNTKKEYVEVVITFKDKEKTKRTYLIEPRTKIECDETSQAGPIEMESLSFAALKRLTIKGYIYREPQPDQNDKNDKTQHA